MKTRNLPKQLAPKTVHSSSVSSSKTTVEVGSHPQALQDLVDILQKPLQETCSYCEGVGMVRLHIACSVCDGTGKVIVEFGE